MTEDFLPRTISFVHDREPVQIDAQTALTHKVLAGHPLILLGEAGSGKSELLRKWAGGQVVTAQQLINGFPAPQGRSFIDGLDEVAGLRNGGALDSLLAALEARQNSNFVIACRVADWRNASMAATIKKWTGVEPIVLTIDPLGKEEILRFLQQRIDDAGSFFAHYEDRGLGEWLGNPQTLHMLADVARNRPETTGELFQRYVEKTSVEHRKQDTPLADASQQEILDVLGALFAAIIIGGYNALTLAPGADRREDDLPLSECKAMPSVKGLSEEQLKSFLTSRLVLGAGQDRFTYQHRRIGEYLGARWLAAQAKSRELQGRILGALRHGQLVPSNLRGLWGWLAEYPELAAEVIRSDPLAVIEYGNADSFEPKAARLLLEAVERVEDESKSFTWHDYRAASLVQSALSPDVERILTVPGSKRFWTQFILLRQMRHAEVVSRHQATLRRLMLDSTMPYATRDAAGDALADYGNLNDWAELIRQLTESNDRESLRLALVMMCKPKVGVKLNDYDFAKTVYDYSGLTPRFAGGREIGTVGLFYHGSRQVIGDERLDGMLNALTVCAARYLTKERNLDAWDVEHLFFDLLKRRLELGNVEPDRLWEWLTQPNYNHSGGTRENQEWLNGWLRANDDMRRALQRKVLDECLQEPRSLQWRLHEIADGLHPTIDDVISLLDWLPEADARWSELIWFAPWRDEGARAREAAERHVRTEKDRQLLRKHANPPPPPYEEKRRLREEQRKREQQERRDEHRASYLTSRLQMRAGEWGALAGPAQVYMGRTYEADLALPPEERIGAWIGEDLQVDAFVGFEAFLIANPPQPPSALQIAESHAESRHWHAALILSAALAERWRTGRGFADLSTERLQAGLFAERVAFLDDKKWEPLREELISEVQRRGAWAETASLFIKPQLRKDANHVSWLWRVLDSADGTMLAVEFLQNFPRIAAEPEEALIDQLLKDGSEASLQVLAEVARQRLTQQLDPRRMRNWQAVEVILGTIPPEQLTAIEGWDRSFLWVLRDRMGGHRHGEWHTQFSPALLAVIVAAFAPLWPWTPHPMGVTRGNDNDWNATDFLVSCLNILAADPSADATEALATLKSVDHGYGERIARSIADQRRARADAEWRSKKVAQLAELVTDGPPVDHADLQRVLLAELDTVQAKIKSSPEDVWRIFYAHAADLEPHLEEQCSDALVTLLKQTKDSLDFDRESHLGDDREGDILCRSNSLEVVIECKRHWHKDLWTAFDWQLAQQQAVDWRARGYGIYVVYWFGTHKYNVKGPPRGSGIAKPSSPAELEAALRELIHSAGLSTIAVKVLDLSRDA